MATASLSLLQGDPTTWGNPPVGKTYVGVNAIGQVTTRQSDGSINTIFSTPEVSTYSNMGGATTVVAASVDQIASVNISGLARNVPIILATAGIVDGQQLRLRLDFLPLDGLTIRVYDSSVLGVLLSSFDSSTGSGITSAFYAFYGLGGQWFLLNNQVPASS